MGVELEDLYKIQYGWIVKLFFFMLGFDFRKEVWKDFLISFKI